MWENLQMGEFLHSRGSVGIRPRQILFCWLPCEQPCEPCTLPRGPSECARECSCNRDCTSLSAASCVETIPVQGMLHCGIDEKRTWRQSRLLSVKPWKVSKPLIQIKLHFVLTLYSIWLCWCWCYFLVKFLVVMLHCNLIYRPFDTFLRYKTSFTKYFSYDKCLVICS